MCNRLADRVRAGNGRIPSRPLPLLVRRSLANHPDNPPSFHRSFAFVFSASEIAPRFGEPVCGNLRKFRFPPFAEPAAGTATV